MLFRFPQFLRPILRPLSIAQERKNIAMKNFKTPKIELNEQEERVCRLLVDVASHLRQHHQELPPVTLRIAGGWVRDKLMNTTSHDVDIALDTMMGYDFAMWVGDYVQNVLHQPDIIGHHIAKIKSNPEKSKHLETATVRIYGMDIDFVNLRREVYEPGSRIPQIGFGTPQEDALRRDLTINALFYNLHTNEVEDFIGTGIADIHNEIIRTPLPPFETFLDDPLRVLRTIRFASRFGYRMVDEIKSAVQQQEIQHALAKVISRERIGEEVKKMMSGPRPHQAIEYVCHLGIYENVFHPPQLKKSKCDIHKAIKMVKAIERLLETTALGHLASFYPPSYFAITSKERRLLLTAASLVPYEKLKCTVKITRVREAETSAVLEACKGSLKLPNAEAEFTSSLVSSIASVQALVHQMKSTSYNTLSESNRTKLRLDLGRQLRAYGQSALGNHYPLIFLFALASEVSEKSITDCPRSHDNHLISINPSEHQVDNTIDDSILAPYMHFLRLVQQLGVLHVHQERPIYDGTTLIIALENELKDSEFLGPSQSLRPGRWVGDALLNVVDWQLQNNFLCARPCLDDHGAFSGEFHWVDVDKKIKDACLRYIADRVQAGEIDITDPAKKKKGI